MTTTTIKCDTSYALSLRQCVCLLVRYDCAAVGA